MLKYSDIREGGSRAYSEKKQEEKSGVMAWGRTIPGFVIPRKAFRKPLWNNVLRYPHHKAVFGESSQQSLHNRAPLRKTPTGYLSNRPRALPFNRRRSMHFGGNSAVLAILCASPRTSLHFNALILGLARFHVR